MIRRLTAITAWLLLGHAAAAGLFWWLLRVPESSGLTLIVSGVLVLAIAVLLLWVHGSALAAWQPDTTTARSVRRGWATVVPALAAALLFLACWWITSRAAAWHTAYSGQIDAWIIASSGKSGTAWLHHTIDAVVWVARWGLGLTLSLSLAAWAIAGGFRALAGTRWLTSALNPLRWIAVAALVALAIVHTWHWIYWRPAHLTLAMEPWFVGAKLAAAALLASLGWALVLRVVTPGAAGSRQ
jgi:hypothetical protein